MMRLKIIKNEIEYDAALERLDVLMDATPGSPEEDELQVLSLLVENYEAEHYKIDLPDPVDAVIFRMEQEGLKRKDLAQYLGSQSRVSEVLGRKRKLSLAMIRSLHKGLGISYEVLMNEPAKKLGECNYLHTDFPFGEMFNRGYFGAFNGSLSNAKEYGEELLEELFSAFGGESPDIVFCRKNNNDVDTFALKAWQAKVIHMTKEIKIPEYKKDKIEESFFKDIVKLSFFEQGPKLVREMLNKLGIHMIILEHLPKTYLDGACFTTPSGRPVIAMTLRYDRLDNFWFTLLHELVHLYLHLDNGETAFFDDTNLGPSKTTDPIEIEANNFAGEILVPAKYMDEYDLIQKPTTSKILDLADKLSIAPGIVAGRVRWERKDYKIFPKLIGNKEVRRLFFR